MAHLKKVYGRSAMAEVMQDAINASVGEALTERSERAATQPKVDLPEDQAVINKVLDGEADLAFDVSYEVLPPVELMDFKTIKLDSPVVEIADDDVDTEVQRVFRQNRGYETKGDDGVVETATISASPSTARSTARPSRAAPPTTRIVMVGSGEFIPGFEEQLVGMKKGETRADRRSPSPPTTSRKICRARRPSSTSPSSTSMRRRPASSTTSSPRRSASRTSLRCARR